MIYLDLHFWCMDDSEVMRHPCEISAVKVNFKDATIEDDVYHHLLMPKDLASGNFREILLISSSSHKLTLKEPELTECYATALVKLMR